MKDDDIELIKALNAANAKAGDMGITQEYNKENRDKLWDSTKGKAEYKDKVFGDRQTVKDPISGKTLHRDQQAAQNKYHMKNGDGENVSTKWAEHSAETDHINALKDIHDKAKHNPFLTDNDLKEIANSDENYRVLSKSQNASKGEKSDWQIILDKNSDISREGKVQMAKEKIRADAVIQGKLAARTVKNIGTEFGEGAKDALIGAAIPLMSEALRKMVVVAQGKESLGDAAKDVGKTTMNVAVAGGGNKLVLDAVKSQLTNSSNTVLQKFAQSNAVGQIVAVASIVSQSAVRYINGEIDGKEFVEEVGERGVAMTAGMIGGSVGRIVGTLIGGVFGTMALPGGGTLVGAEVVGKVGEILGAIITTVACSAIISTYRSVKNTLKHMDDHMLKESQIRKLETEALAEMEKQRSAFKDIVEREYGRWDDEIQSGLDKMLTYACEETFDLQGATEGLDQILALFGKSVAFKTREEYEAQLDMPLKLNF